MGCLQFVQACLVLFQEEGLGSRLAFRHALRVGLFSEALHVARCLLHLVCDGRHLRSHLRLQGPLQPADFFSSFCPLRLEQLHDSGGVCGDARNFSARGGCLCLGCSGAIGCCSQLGLAAIQAPLHVTRVCTRHNRSRGLFDDVAEVCVLLLQSTCSRLGSLRLFPRLGQLRGQRIDALSHHV